MLSNMIYVVILVIWWANSTLGTYRQKWTPEEDKMLINAVEEFNYEWSIIAKYFPNRIPKQCRERWINHFDPKLKTGPLTEEDINNIFKLQEKHGNQWTKIGKILGKSPNQIKNW